MAKKKVIRGVVCTALAVSIGVCVLLLLGGAAAAPTTTGLILQTSSHSGTAAAGNRNEAYVLVSAYNEAGSIRAIPGGSFSVAVVASPNGADPVKKVSVAEPVSGVYKIAVTPELSSHRWSSGKYVLAVTFTTASGSGVAVAGLEIK
jgi:hypothetical protein